MTSPTTRSRPVAGAARLRWVLVANQIAAIAGALLVVLLFLAVVRSGWLLSLAVPIGGLAGGLGVAVRRLDRGDLLASLRIYTACTWVVGVCVTLVVPFIWPTLMLTVFMPLVLAVPYVRRRELVALIGTSVVIVVAVAITGVTELATGVTDQVDPWSPWLRHLVVVASLSAMFVMVVVVIWQQHAEAEVRADLVRHSRARLSSVADEERRRIERDLHDGAQQRLVGLAVRLGMLSVQLDGRQAEAVGAMSDELTNAIQELRELAHGIYPPLLANEGLASALRAAARRSSLPTAVDSTTTRRFPADVETALYFCGVEAMQNAAKHAGPGASVAVSVGYRDGVVELRVVDDGRGLAPGTVPHGGLLNMQDRIGAVGGSVDISANPEGGVSVVATVAALAT